MEAMGAVCDTLVVIRSIIAAIAAKAKMRSHLFGRCVKSKTGDVGYDSSLVNICKLVITVI
jgi:hypothetical protein